MSTKVIFLSRHDPAPAMIDQLRGKLGDIEIVQFKGTTAKFRRERGTDNVSFDETLGDVTTRHTVPANSVFVAVLPVSLQLELFGCKPGALLLPVTERKVIEGKFNVRGEPEVEFSYVGLKKIDKMDIVTSLFCGAEVSDAARIASREAVAGR